LLPFLFFYEFINIKWFFVCLFLDVLYGSRRL
jgi:hypothetical protein